MISQAYSNTGSMPSAHAAKDARPISALNVFASRYHDQSTELAELLRILEERLQPILQPLFDDEKSGRVTPELDGSVPILNIFDAVHISLDKMTAVLKSIHGRLVI